MRNSKRNKSVSWHHANSIRLSLSSIESLESRMLLAGDLIARFRADDLNDTLEDGETVALWEDSIRQIQADTTGEPMLVKNAFGARSAIRLNASDGMDLFTVPEAQNPMAGAGDFSIALVFSTSSTDLRGQSGEWFHNTGLVDSNGFGISSDWGLSLNSLGQVSVGVGANDFSGKPSTVYSDVSGLADSQRHIAMFMRSGGTISVYVDGNLEGHRDDASETPRFGAIDMVIGALRHRDGAFTGDLAEIQIYDGGLSPTEVVDLHTELTAYYEGRPAPQPVDDIFFGTSGGPVVADAGRGLLANDSFVAHPSLSVEVIRAPQEGPINVNANGAFQYTPPPEFVGFDSFTYRLKDDSASSDPVTVRIYVGMSPVRISEFMVANVGGLATRVRSDPERSFRGETENHDWIEIQNLTSDEIELGGLHLTDDADVPAKWQFPRDTRIEPNGYLVVFASRLGITNPELDEQEKLHTNFKLALAGEYLGLSSDDGLILDEYENEYPTQFPGVSYGIDETGKPGHLISPSPGLPNGAAYLGNVMAPTVSVQRGFYDNPFVVELANQTDGAEIRYTTDGSLPTATHGEIYSEPISIASTTNLRVAAFIEGHIPSAVVTNSYIFIDEVKSQTDELLPDGEFVFWSTEMDPRVVDAPEYRDIIDDALLSLPTLSVTLEYEDIFGITGIHRGQNLMEGSGGNAGDPNHPDWVEEQDASVELIYPDGEKFRDADGQKFQGFDINAGIRIQGGGGRWRNGDYDRKQSFGLRFREDYGVSQLQYPFFESAPFFADTAVDSFDSLVLRAGHNKSWSAQWDNSPTVFTRDQLGRDLQLAASGIGSHGAFMHLYINGIYWGLYNPTERADSNFTSSYFGGDNEDWYIAKAKGGTVSGDDNRFREWSRTISKTEDFALLQEYLAVDEYIDMALINVYANVGDFPQYYYGNRNDVPGPTYFFNWDQEDSFGGGSRRTSADPNAGLLGSMAGFNNMWTNNAEFRMRLADRAYRAVNGGVLSDEAVTAMWGGLTNHIYDAIVAESARWGDEIRSRTPYRRDVEWESARNAVRDDFVGRGERLLDVLRSTSRRGLAFYPSIDPGEFSHAGGTVDAPLQLEIGNPNDSGVVYYTMDGSDPRVTGGEVSESASVFDGSTLVIDRTTEVKTRVLKDGEWSALNEAIYSFDEEPTIAITELMFNPADPTAEEIAAGLANNDEFEFVEVYNYGSGPVNLLNYEFTEGIKISFPSFTLAAGEHGVIVSSEAAFNTRYGDEVNVIGQYEGRLSNGGERLTLMVGERTVQQITFDDQWYAGADGGGRSLEIVDAAHADRSDWSRRELWRASLELGGSPGQASRAATLPGDANLDSIFNQDDIDVIVQAGKYLSGDPASYADGDFNGDGVFDQYDIVAALQTGQFRGP